MHCKFESGVYNIFFENLQNASHIQGLQQVCVLSGYLVVSFNIGQNHIFNTPQKQFQVIIFFSVRIANMKSEVVSTERCTMQRINNEASSLYNYKPHLSLGLLYNILAEFTDLPTGSYLLRHTEKDGPFVALMEETEKRG